jgi:hypothetical protein
MARQTMSQRKRQRGDLIFFAAVAMTDRKIAGKGAGATEGANDEVAEAL